MRSGFVSNSSSASFIINTSISEDKLLGLIGYNSDTMNPYDIKEYLEENLESYKDYDSEFWMKVKDQIKDMLDMYEYKERKIGSYVSQELDMDAVTTRELVKKFLKYRHIHLEPAEDGSGIEVSDHITMYNSFSDFSSLSKEILFLLTVAEYPFTWEIDCDD